MSDDLDLLEAELGERLGRTFRAAADTVSTVPATRSRTRRWRRAAAIGGLSAALVGSVAAWRAHEPGQIERVPTESAIMSGHVSTGDWYLLPTGIDTPEWGTEGCDYPGVSFVAEQINKPGLEWNGGGVVYGEPSGGPNERCANVAAWLADPTKFSIGFQRIGYERKSAPHGGYGAFHPTVTAIRVQADDGPAFDVATVPRPDAPGGPRYVGFSVPGSTQIIRYTLIDASGNIVGGPFTSEGVRL